MLALAVLLCFALPAHAQQNGWQKAADVASYGTLGAGLGLEVYDAFHCPNVGHCIEQLLFGVSTAWAIPGILKTVTHKARPCAPDCGGADPYAAFPSQHAAFAGQTVWGDHKKLKAILAGTTATFRVLSRDHDTIDATVGFGIGWGTTFVW